MAKNVDYSKIKAMAQSILECIGDDSEGENPSLPSPDNAINDGGQDSLTELMDESEEDYGNTRADADDTARGSADSETKKKKRDSAIAMMGSVLASKFNK